MENDGKYPPDEPSSSSPLPLPLPLPPRRPATGWWSIFGLPVAFYRRSAAAEIAPRRR
jgi:hypothetical protein